MQWRSSCCLQTTPLCVRMCILNAFMPTLCLEVHWTVHAMAQQLLSTDHSSVCAYACFECIHTYFVPGPCMQWRSSCCLQTTPLCVRMRVLNAFMPTLCLKVHWTVHAMAQQLLSTDHSSACAYVCLDAFMPTLCLKVHWTVHAMAQQLLSTDNSSVCVCTCVLNALMPTLCLKVHWTVHAMAQQRT